MSKKKFSQEEIDLLSNNPYTILVTENTLSFTIEFKELFWKDYCSGLSPRRIITQYGYNPEILGTSRLDGILRTIKKAAITGKAFSNVVRPVPKTVKTIAQLSPPDTDVKKLEQEVKYLRQEVEFLKKIISVRTSGM